MEALALLIEGDGKAARALVRAARSEAAREGVDPRLVLAELAAAGEASGVARGAAEGPDADLVGALAALDRLDRVALVMTAADGVDGTALRERLAMPDDVLESSVAAARARVAARLGVAEEVAAVRLRAATAAPVGQYGVRPPRRRLPAGTALLATGLVGVVVVGSWGGSWLHGRPAAMGGALDPAQLLPVPFRSTEIPSGTDLLWYSLPEDANAVPRQLRAVTWDGRPAGTAVLSYTMGSRPSPDGHRYLDGTSVVALGVADASPEGSVDFGFGPTRTWMWADDSEHICSLSATRNSVDVAVLDLAGGGRALTSLGVLGGVPAAPSHLFRIEACSERRNLLIVSVSDPVREPARVIEVIEVSLTSGHELARLDYSGEPAVVASADGTMLGEFDAAAGTAVRAMPTGTAFLAVPLRLGTPLGIAADGTRVALTGGVVDADGSVVYTPPAGWRIADALPHAGGAELAVAIAPPGGPLATRALVITADGRAVALPDGAVLRG